LQAENLKMQNFFSAAHFWLVRAPRGHLGWIFGYFGEDRADPTGDLPAQTLTLNTRGTPMNLKSWKLTLCTGIALCALMAPAFGALLSQDTSLFIAGVDNKGNPSYTIGATGAGKIYKETITGIIVIFGVGIVPNQSGKAQNYVNKGFSIKDPFTATWKKSTSDAQAVGIPSFGFASSSLLVIYNPAAVP
jgi:hypothetical protein